MFLLFNTHGSSRAPLTLVSAILTVTLVLALVIADSSNAYAGMKLIDAVGDIAKIATAITVLMDCFRTSDSGGTTRPPAFMPANCDDYRRVGQELYDSAVAGRDVRRMMICDSMALVLDSACQTNKPAYWTKYFLLWEEYHKVVVSQANVPARDSSTTGIVPVPGPSENSDREDSTIFW